MMRLKLKEKLLEKIKPKFPKFIRLKGKVIGRGKSHLIQIRKKGKFKTVATNTFNRGQAKRLGQLIVDNTVARSYRLKQTNKKANTKVLNLDDLSRKFRAGKTFKARVEKRKFAIDTRGEVRGLKAAKFVKRLGLTPFKVRRTNKKRVVKARVKIKFIRSKGLS